MNPRRVHELLRENFPQRPACATDWVVVADERGLRFDVVRELIRRHIASDDLVVEANRKAGDHLPIDQAIEFVARHLGQGRIRLSDREFTGFVVIESTGVASAWVKQGTSTAPLAPVRQIGR